MTQESLAAPRAQAAQPSLHLRVHLHKYIVGLLYLALLLMPFSTSAQAGSVIVAFGLPFAFAAALLIGVYFLTKGLRLDHRLIIPLIATGLVLYSVAVYTLVAPSVAASASRALVHALGFVVFLYLLSLSSQPPATRSRIYQRVANAFVWSGGVLAFYFLTVFVVASIQNDPVTVLQSRTLGGLMSLPWGATNVIAGALLMPLFVAFAQGSLMRRTGRWLRWLAIGGMLAAIAVSQSRGATVALVCAVFALSVARKSWKPLLLLVAAAILLAVGIAVFAPNIVDGVLSLRLGGNDQGALNGRADIWNMYLSFFDAQPLKPIGYYGSLYVFEATAHNLLISSLLEQGIIGLLAVLAMYAVASVWSWIGSQSKIPRVSAALACYFAGTVALFVDAQFEDPNFTQIYIFYSWIFFALLYLVAYVVPAVPQTIGRRSPSTGGHANS